VTAELRLTGYLFVYGKWLGTSTAQVSVNLATTSPDCMAITMVKLMDLRPTRARIKVEGAGPRCQVRLSYSRDGFPADAMHSTSMLTYLRAEAGLEPPFERIVIKKVIWGAQYSRSAFHETAFCGMDRNRTMTYWAETKDPRDFGPGHARFFTAPDGRFDKWKVREASRCNSEVFDDANRQWAMICSEVWTPGRQWIKGFDVRAVSKIVAYDHYSLDVTWESLGVYAIAAGKIYYENFSSILPGDGEWRIETIPVTPSTADRFGLDPCRFIWEGDADATGHRDWIGDENPGSCEEFTGVGNGYILVSVHRRFMQWGEEVDPDDPDGGFSGMAAPLNAYWPGTSIDNLILLAGNPRLGTSDILPPRPFDLDDCDEPSWEESRWPTEQPNLLAHELGHTLPDGFRMDWLNEALGRLMVSWSGHPFERGFDYDTPTEGPSHEENCQEILNRSVTE
jgi:hypothetical protein